MEGFGLATGIGQDGGVQFGRSASFVQFITSKEVDREASEKAGRPVHVPVVKIRVIHAGERDVVEVVAKEHHKLQHPKQWAAFEAGRQQIPDGTSIELLFPQDPSIVANLNELKFFTVEQLANATDSQLQGIGMGSREFQNKAKKYLEAATGAQGFHKMQAELDQIKSERDQLKDAMLKLQARLDVLENDEPRRGPGRPRKTEA